MGERPDASVSPRLATALREARDSWPGVALEDGTFARYLAGRDAATSEADETKSLLLRDLYLACACAAGDPQAVAAFDRIFLAPLADIVARAGFPAPIGADVVQILRERLLVGHEGRPPRITEYGGRAPLSAWLRVAAIREAGKVRRHENVHAGLRPDPPRPPPTPEEEAIRARYGKAFEDAFSDAFRGLPAEDRLTLRLHFSEGLNLDGLATTFGFSRATAGRRLLLARARLKDETLRLFGERFDASGTEVESVLRVLRSGLEVSFEALVTSA
jgi:RNA polymerase sigma-70 factor (ECF subfamily)